MNDFTTLRLDGGDRLRDALRELSKRLGRSGTVQIGFLEGATYADGTPVATVAAIQEFGAPSRNIPPRPFFRQMIAQHTPEWSGDFAGILDAADDNPEVSLDRMGALIAAQLRDSIQQFTTPALAQTTVQAKGNDKALVDTGHMLQSIDHHVAMDDAS
nr:hypothetical protein [uncultured Lichenicoccus sp.]